MNNNRVSPVSVRCWVALIVLCVASLAAHLALLPQLPPGKQAVAQRVLLISAIEGQLLAQQHEAAAASLRELMGPGRPSVIKLSARPELIY